MSKSIQQISGKKKLRSRDKRETERKKTPTIEADLIVVSLKKWRF